MGLTTRRSQLHYNLGLKPMTGQISKNTDFVDGFKSASLNINLCNVLPEDMELVIQVIREEMAEVKKQVDELLDSA